MNQDAYNTMMVAEKAYLLENGWVESSTDSWSCEGLNRHALKQGHAVNVQKQLDRHALTWDPEHAAAVVDDEAKYGIWVTTSHWATEDDGGTDLTGLFEEVQVTASNWQEELQERPSSQQAYKVTYRVLQYP